MEIKHKITPKFYQNLAKLFFAISALNKQVYDKEFNKLKTLVKEQWRKNEGVNDNTVIQIVSALDWLKKNEKLNSKLYVDDFVNYKNKYPDLFTADIKKWILETAHAIAVSFLGLNKSELIILAKLDIEFKKNRLMSRSFNSIVN